MTIIATLSPPYTFSSLSFSCDSRLVLRALLIFLSLRLALLLLWLELSSESEFSRCRSFLRLVLMLRVRKSSRLYSSSSRVILMRSLKDLNYGWFLTHFIRCSLMKSACDLSLD